MLIVLLIERINPSLTLQLKEIIQSAIFIRIEIHVFSIFKINGYEIKMHST